MRVADRLGQRAAAAMLGRETELGQLRTLLERQGPRIAHVHGLPGIGKSTLLRGFLSAAAAQGARVILLDCRGIEPTPDAFLATLGELAGSPRPGSARIADCLPDSGETLVLGLDAFEHFRLLDPWLRLHFIPEMTENVRIVLAGRHPPATGWLSEGWEDLTLDLPLGPLQPDDASALLKGEGLRPEQCALMAGRLHGHPLALRLAATTLRERPDVSLDDTSLQGVMDRLTAVYLEDIDDPLLRRIIEGAAVVRRVTVSLLAALFPGSDAEAAYSALERLPFTESASDGLRIHEAVRTPLARTLHARNPHQYLEHRRRAWRALTAEAGTAGRPDLWRYTADMLYLIENPVCREAFFPTAAARLVVEHPRADDRPTMQAIARGHEGPRAVECLRMWMDTAPGAFAVVRGPGGGCEGFCCRLDPARVPVRALADDAVTAAWRDHLRTHPVPAGNSVLFIRRWLARSEGERPGGVQAAAWLDLKRTYMEMRPALSRVYLTVTDLAPYAAIAAELGFQVHPELAVTMDGHTYHTAVLEFGADSVDGWLATLAARELGLAPPADILDRDARELVLDEGRVPLTPLEYGVLVHLQDQAGRAVSRQTLLHDVWGSTYTGWSNKVDAVVAALRRKMGRHADCIETVTGVGYRYRGKC
ncbi:winged helix-turn-helix domain-containing protein [Aquisalimonas lutea]|uniref:winged helix-turn-helix domain-containing protein n=1 Tax=Aquisalimonas lutea TaxID=1327750 RepID=UPI0025B3C039|nr:winged helix-turn-helix domain-containing protein [Aquisalimonas lutea]MDN3517596.1 winged helix-turn-helix domain-containing protein [Aquisalimonas lutea]